MKLARLRSAGFLIVALGVTIVLIGIPSHSSDASIAGVVLIGPFPIAFGAGPESGPIVLLSLVAAVLLVLAIYLSLIVRRRGG